MPDGAEDHLLELLQDALFEITSVPSSSSQLLNANGKPHRWLLHLQPKSQLSLKLWQCQRFACAAFNVTEDCCCRMDFHVSIDRVEPFGLRGAESRLWAPPPPPPDPPLPPGPPPPLASTLPSKIPPPPGPYPSRFPPPPQRPPPPPGPPPIRYHRWRRHRRGPPLETQPGETISATDHRWRRHRGRPRPVIDR